jgi:hypothetical protein
MLSRTGTTNSRGGPAKWPGSRQKPDSTVASESGVAYETCAKIRAKSRLFSAPSCYEPYDPEGLWKLRSLL